jgi:DNA-binding MarR family transcriptional regulator
MPAGPAESAMLQPGKTRTDGRARQIRVTERGRANVAVALAAIGQVEAEWTAHLGTRRIKQLRDALTALREITDPHR